MKKALIVVLPILFTAQACNFLFGELGGEGGTGAEGIFFSTDQGETWEQAVSEDERDLAQAKILRIFIEQAAPENLLAASLNFGLLASQSRGEKWFALLPNFAAYQAFIKPGSPNEIFAAGARSGLASIQKSSDRGGTWSEIYHQPAEAGEAEVTSLVFDPRNRSVFYAALSTGTIIKSTDAGINWRESGDFDERIRRVAVDQAGNVFLLRRSGLMKSTDGGMNWTKLEVNPEAQEFNDLVFDPSNGNIYAATDKGLFRSGSSSTSWTRLSLPVEPDASNVSAVAVNPKNSRQIYAAILSTIYRSDDDGFTWRTVSLPTRQIMGHIAIDPEEPNRVYAGLR